MGRKTIIPGSLKLDSRNATAPARRSVSQAEGDARTGEDFTFTYAANLSHRLPLMYCVVLFDTLVLMITFHAVAPPILTIWLPLPCIAVLVARVEYWLP